jgi:hypothetical protein
MASCTTSIYVPQVRIGQRTAMEAIKETSRIVISRPYRQRSRQHLSWPVVALALMLVASACRQAPEEQLVQVELKEFSIGADKTSAEAGPVTFTAVNAGTENHELMIIKTELDLLSLPTVETGAVDVPHEAGVAARGVEVVGEIEEFPAGETRSATFELEAANYVLICNLVETMPDGTTDVHYKEGMRASFTVE